MLLRQQLQPSPQLHSKDFFELIMDVIFTLVDGDIGSVVVYDRLSDTPHVLVERALTRHGAQLLTDARVIQLMKKVVREGKAIIMDSGRASDEELSWLRQYGISALIVSPMVGVSDVVGAICVASRTRKRFKQSEVETVCQITSKLGELFLSLLPIPSDHISLRRYLESTASIDTSQLLERNLDMLLHLGLLVTQCEVGAFVLCSPRTKRVKTIIMHGNREVVERLKEHLKAHLNETEVEAFTIEDVHRVLSSFMKHYFASVANSSGTVGGFFLFGDGNDFPPGRKQQVVTQIAVFTGTVIERIASMYVLERAIWTDPVTGLVNRQCWLAKTEEELARARRMNLPVSVVLIDLDGFKAINDFLGHAKGDIVLRHVGSVLRKHVRRYDVVARLGGDEFAILLPATPPSGAMVVAERVRSLIESLDLSNVLGCATRLTASIGVATAPSAGETPEKLLEAADRALTTAKHLGKNRIVRDERSKENGEMAWANISLMFDTRLMKWFVNRICHEINNPAQGILGIIELLLRRDEMTAEDVKDELLKVQNLVLRIRSVTHNLATASHADLVKYAQEFAETMRRISHEEDSEGDETAKEADA